MKRSKAGTKKTSPDNGLTTALPYRPPESLRLEAVDELPIIHPLRLGGQY